MHMSYCVLQGSPKTGPVEKERERLRLTDFETKRQTRKRLKEKKLGQMIMSRLVGWELGWELMPQSSERILPFL